MQFNDKVYDFIKWLVELFLPGLGTLYFALAKIWGFPYGEEVIGSLTAAALFLGTMIGISRRNYVTKGEFDGEVAIDTTNVDRDVVALRFNAPLEQLQGKSLVTLNVTDALAQDEE